MPESQLPADIEQLRQRFNKLNEQRIQSETQLKAAEERLAELRDQARKEFGVDDLDALTERLKAMEAENLAKRTEYEALLSGIESKLAEIDREYQARE